MAWDFMRKGALSKIDVQHDRKKSGSYVVESFIARDDDSVFVSGAWVLGVKVQRSGGDESWRPQGELVIRLRCAATPAVWEEGSMRRRARGPAKRSPSRARATRSLASVGSYPAQKHADLVLDLVGQRVLETGSVLPGLGYM